MSASIPVTGTMTNAGRSKAEAIPAVYDPGSWLFTGMILTPIRLVAGFLFFSAFWRRFIDAPDKMNPEAIGYVGEKFNHFMPHAIFGQKELIEYLLLNPSLLHVFLIVFTILEGLCGLGLITGTLTRISAFGITAMSWGVLTGSGWIGTTCLDEWQIGVLGMTGGLLVMTGGAGPWAIDHFVAKRWPAAGNSRWFRLLASGPLFAVNRMKYKFAYAAVAVGMMAITLVTYQAFFSGLFGKLHNHSVRPEIELSAAVAKPADKTITFNLYRTGGPDTYGAFLIKASLINAAGAAVAEWNPAELSQVAAADIENKYLTKVRPHKNSLLAPLGASAQVTLRSEKVGNLVAGSYALEIEDVSGLKWRTQVDVKG